MSSSSGSGSGGVQPLGIVTPNPVSIDITPDGSITTDVTLTFLFRDTGDSSLLCYVWRSGVFGPPPAANPSITLWQQYAVGEGVYTSGTSSWATNTWEDAFNKDSFNYSQLTGSHLQLVAELTSNLTITNDDSASHDFAVGFHSVPSSDAFDVTGIVPGVTSSSSVTFSNAQAKTLCVYALSSPPAQGTVIAQPATAPFFTQANVFNLTNPTNYTLSFSGGSYHLA